MISVIVPVYNTAPYLPRCIASLQRQTVRDLEILLVDNGSTDDSLDICRSFAAGDARIKVLQEARHGAACARRKGIEVAKGDWMTFVDSDDWLDPDAYQRMLEATQRNDTIDIVVGGMVININGVDRPVRTKHPSQIDDADAAMEIMMTRKIYGWELCDKIYRRNLFDRLPPLIDGRPYMEDLECNCYLFRQARNLAFSSTYGYHYFMRKDSVTHLAFSLDWICEIRRCIHLRKLLAGKENLVYRLMELEFFSAKNFLESCWRAQLHSVPEYQEAQDALGETAASLGKEVSKLYFCSQEDGTAVWRERKQKMAEDCRRALENSGQTGLYLYGAGVIGREVYSVLKESGITPQGFVVSKLPAQTEVVDGLPIFQFSELSSEERKRAVFGIAAKKRHAKEIMEILKSSNACGINLGQYSFFYEMQ